MLFVLGVVQMGKKYSPAEKKIEIQWDFLMAFTNTKSGRKPLL
jgi:hypothetical protein